MSRFEMVRDPATGRIDMVASAPKPIEQYGRCSSLVSALGQERHDRFFPDDFDGAAADAHDMHDATIVEIMSLLANHARDEMLGSVARDYIDATRLVRDGVLPMATVAFTMNAVIDNGHSDKALMILNATIHETVMVMFCSCGDTLAQPLAYFRENGRFRIADVDEDCIDRGMVDAEVQMRRWENTKVAVAAVRAQAERPEGVVDMAAFRTLRAVRG